MKTLLRLSVLALLACSVVSARADAPKTPTYTVVVEAKINEQGLPEEIAAVEDNDPTLDKLLCKEALVHAADIKVAPRLKDGQPVKFTVRQPYNFNVEDDEGAAANDAPKPSIHGSVVQPVYPPELAAKQVVGGAILELVIDVDGKAKTVRVMRASHPEFGKSAEEAVRQWNFNPAKKDGQAVESRWRIAVGFSINGIEPEWIWRIAPRPSLGGFVVGRVVVPKAATPAPGNANPAPATPAAPAQPQPAAPGK